MSAIHCKACNGLQTSFSQVSQLTIQLSSHSCVFSIWQWTFRTSFIVIVQICVPLRLRVTMCKIHIGTYCIPLATYSQSSRPTHSGKARAFRSGISRLLALVRFVTYRALQVWQAEHLATGVIKKGKYISGVSPLHLDLVLNHVVV